MKGSVIASIDSSGRLLLPEELRREAGVEPGIPLEISLRNGRIEIEPAPGPVNIVSKGAIFVVEPTEPRAILKTETVEATLREVRELSSEG